MANERRPMGTITAGGKGSTFSSSSVFLIANNLASVGIDSSALSKLSTSKKPLDLEPYLILSPSNLTHEESRASLAGALSKLMLSSNTTRIRPELPSWISQTLNSGLSLKSDNLEPLYVTKEERAVLDNCLAMVDGICALLDFKSSVLCIVADVVGAISSEALRANVSSFGSMDSGDGFNHKDAAAVASGLKDLLNGSKMVGKEDISAVSAIPMVHGRVREAARLVHSSARIELNSCLKGCSSDMNEAWETQVGYLARSLRKLGEKSLSRADRILDALSIESLKLNLRALLMKICPNCEGIVKANEQYGDSNFFHLVHELLNCVWKIVSWEMFVAILLLEGPEFFETSQGVAASTDNANHVTDTKIEKKKKKLVLGKGTNSVLQLVKARIQGASPDALDQSDHLSQSAHCIISMLDPKDTEFGSFLQEIKEIVESNETRRLPKIPKGTRDFSKEQMTVRGQAFAIITRVFKRHGAMALKTPAFELRETLLGKYGEDSKLIYDLADQGGELCSLRYDLTVPFARHVAMNGISSFKRYQIADVYRRDNPSKGRYREFCQCDFDIAGQYEKMGPDFEVIKILTELLDELNIGDYEVKLNHRKLLDGMLEICGVPSGKFRTICSSIDKLDKLPFEQVKKEMVEEKGLSVETADKIGTFVGKRGSPMELLTELKQEGSEFLSNEGSKVAIEELEILFKALEMSECVNKVVFDLSLARGLDYYTGMIFEAVFKGTTQVGSIAAGGRYDNLIGMFGTKQVPAVGVSLGIERVFAIMEQIRLDQNQVVRANETQVLVSLLFDDLPLAAKLVNLLWSADISAEFMMTKRVMKHIDRAKQFRIPFVVFVGERELSEGIVKIKNIASAVEEVVAQDAMVQYLKERLVL